MDSNSKIIKRKDLTVLPDSCELSQILETEVVRALPISKQNIHYPDFTTIIDLFKYLKLPIDIFSNDNLDIHAVVTQGQQLVEDAIKIIFKKEVDENLKQKFDNIYDYLAFEDTPEKSDIIFVFGSKTPFRAEKALELYNKGLGEMIVVSGGNAIYAQNKPKSEASIYREILLKGGVPENKIILEDQSITVPDNIRRTLNLLDEQGIKYISFILVNSPYVQRRGYTIFKKYLPDSISLYRVNSKTGDQYLKENWFKQENTARIILNEFIKMRGGVAYNTN